MEYTEKASIKSDNIKNGVSKLYVCPNNFLFGVLLFLGREIFLAQKRSNPIERKQLYLLQLILFVGVLVRLVNLSYPQGLNLDEAMGGYDAWCIANFGVDSNLQSYPLYLISWGSGMSALYIYLACPFVKLFGLSEAVYRLPMALVGSVTLLCFYWVLRKTQKDTLLIFCFASFLAICPWHIMKSRIALDASLAPDILFVSLCFILLGYYSIGIKQFIAYIIGFLLVSLTAYAYAASWLVLPLFTISLFLFLYKSKKITITKMVKIGVLMLIIILPLIYLCGILYFDLNQLQIGNITIPKLISNRADATLFLGKEGFSFSKIHFSIVTVVKLFFLGTDGGAVDTTFPLYGIFYNIVSLPFLGYGIWYTYKEKNVLMIFILLLVLSSSLLLLLVSPGITHWNVLWIPLSCFVAYGIYFFVVSYKQCQRLFISMYSILFFLFIITYFNSKIFNPFLSYMIKDDVIYSQKQEFNKIYYPSDIVHSIVLFYVPIDPYTFANSFISDGNPIARAKAYSNIIFGLPSKIEPEKGTAYVVSNASLSSIDLSQFKIKNGQYYTILWND